MHMRKRADCNKVQVFKDVKGCNVVILSCIYVVVELSPNVLITWLIAQEGPGIVAHIAF